MTKEQAEAPTILFTGFPGFIGQRLAPRLLEDQPEARLGQPDDDHVDLLPLPGAGDAEDVREAQQRQGDVAQPDDLALLHGLDLVVVDPVALVEE